MSIIVKLPNDFGEMIGDKMGGLGSGNHWNYGSKSTTNDYHVIDIRKWHRKGLLAPGTAFTTKWLRNDEVVGSIGLLADKSSVMLSYRYKRSDEWTSISYPVEIVWSHCNLGGKRPWFLCPAEACGRRVAILYGGATFSCRHCRKLAYQSQRENYGDRATRQAEKIRDRMGWEPGILNGEGLKPKGMHWKTFERLCLEHNKLVNLSLKDATLRFGINMFGVY